ncbi:hypothetical protein CKA34_21740 (plasmid) [Rhizobium sp. 11515TR]|nr:hypothetical protein CKA34_21740 [Rhizobium sp. 11515TR]
MHFNLLRLTEEENIIVTYSKLPKRRFEHQAQNMLLKRALRKLHLMFGRTNCLKESTNYFDLRASHQTKTASRDRDGSWELDAMLANASMP